MELIFPQDIIVQSFYVSDKKTDTMKDQMNFPRVYRK